VHQRARLIAKFVAATAIAAGGCGPSTAGDTGQFVPLQKDFATFRTWMRFELGVGGDPARADAGTPDGGGQDGGVHIVGPRTIYLNMAPPTGSTSFPVGTILVKTTADGTTTPGETFAMAKRGGTYNMRGAAGWEWFELASATDGTPLIIWRGIVPPAGEGYAGIVGGVCNDCHATFAANDYVGSDLLSLSAF
jgi:hypothetical protein